MDSSLYKNNFLFLLLLIVAGTFSQIGFCDSSSIEFQELKNVAQNQTLLSILDGTEFKLHNTLRPKASPSLKFQIYGATVELVQPIQNGAQWILHTLEGVNQSSIDFSYKSVGGINSSVSEFEFRWHGGGSNQDREVCFHAGYNHASW